MLSLDEVRIRVSARVRVTADAARSGLRFLPRPLTLTLALALTLTPDANPNQGGTVRLLPQSADGEPPATQTWRRTPSPTGGGEGEGEGNSVHGSVRLESAARPGQYLALVRQLEAGCNPVPKAATLCVQGCNPV